MNTKPHNHSSNYGSAILFTVHAQCQLNRQPVCYSKTLKSAALIGKDDVL